MKAILATILLSLLPARVFAQSQLGNLDEALTNATLSDPATLPQQIYSAVALFIRERVFTILISSAIAIAILYFMYGAFLYFTAYGDENKATSAKKTITYAFIGLLIAFMAMGIASLTQQTVVNEQAPQAVAPLSPGN